MCGKFAQPILNIVFPIGPVLEHLGMRLILNNIADSVYWSQFAPKC